ncbi:unnamed protein product [Orchesella dallaii]|uniref:Cytochrome P450 n=1 Tax=Orchesella dallaii TaxID=48710 RepID=A0ABP1RGV5_9HEXA
MITRLEQPWLLIETLWRLHPLKKVHDKAIASMFEFARRRLSEHKLEKEQATQNTSEKEENFQTILDELVDAGANDEDIVHELNTLLFGGHETTAATMHMFFFLMSLHPQHQNQCRKEIDQVFDEPSKFSNGNLFYESLTSLKYVERCLLETLRLLPVAVAYMRRLQAKLRIEYEGKEVDVPPGTSIIIVPWVIHRNEEYYPNPEEFNPDRFLPEENAKRHSHSFLTFSAGPRNCIGIKFGMNEMKTVAAYVLRNFILSTTDKLEDVPLLPYMTLTPQRDYNFRMKKRVYIATKSRDYLTK